MSGKQKSQDTVIQERILKEADPIGFLIRVARGEAFKIPDAENPRKKVSVYPTLEQRMRAHTLLEKRLSETTPEFSHGPVLTQEEMSALREKLSLEIQRLAKETQNQGAS